MVSVLHCQSFGVQTPVRIFDKVARIRLDRVETRGIGSQSLKWIQSWCWGTCPSEPIAGYGPGFRNINQEFNGFNPTAECLNGRKNNILDGQECQVDRYSDLVMIGPQLFVICHNDQQFFV